MSREIVPGPCMEKVTMYRTRDWRRAQKSRYVRRAYLYTRATLPNPSNDFYSWRDKHGKRRFFDSWEDVFERRHLLAKCRSDNRQPCSRSCCGNPRRWFGDVTMQEQRDKLTCKEMFE